LVDAESTPGDTSVPTHALVGGGGLAALGGRDDEAPLVGAPPDSGHEEPAPDVDGGGELHEQIELRKYVSVLELAPVGEVDLAGFCCLPEGQAGPPPMVAEIGAEALGDSAS
jgi:hypothetical protein